MTYKRVLCLWQIDVSSHDYIQANSGNKKYVCPLGAKCLDNLKSKVYTRKLRKRLGMLSMYKKLCFAASSGGHFEQILMLKPLMDKYDSFIVTEKTQYQVGMKGQRMYYLHQVNRKELLFPFWSIINAFVSLRIFIKEKPDVVITTGVLAVIPLCLMAKLSGKKLIYIESFAKISSPTKTGKLMYKYADQFYVQWKSMLEFYPRAICLGGIY